MSVKTSISLTEQQSAFARDLVEKGHYSSVSAVLQRGLEMLRHEVEEQELSKEALRALLEERRKGPFISEEQARAQTRAFIARKRAEYGLED